MKRRCNVLCLLCIVSILASCDDFMDVHKEFIKDGEVIYAPKMDSMAFLAGHNRIGFKYWLNKSPNVRTIDLRWNDGKDSLIIPVTPTGGLEEFMTIVPDLEENSYTFQVQTIDMYGNKSLSTMDFGASYGDIYQSSLSQRGVSSVEIKEQSDGLNAYVSLFSAREGLLRTEIRYESKIDGSKMVVSAAADEDGAFCPNAKDSSSFEYRSLYVPEPNAIDSFATEWVVSNYVFPDVFQYDVTGWRVIGVSSQADEGQTHYGSNLIDGIEYTAWHSKWREPAAEPPHWVVIDMLSPKNITKLDIVRANNWANTVQYFLGDDPDPDAASWTKVGEAVFPSLTGTWPGGTYFMSIESTDKVTRGRYFKMVLPDSNSYPHIFINSIFLFGSI